MKRMILMLPLILLLAGCHWFFPFYKYDEDPDPVDVDWVITSSGGSLWHLEEKAEGESATAEIVFDGSNFKFNDSVSYSGVAPTFGNLLNFGDQSPFTSMLGYPDWFLDNFTLGTSGYFNSDMQPDQGDSDWYEVDWNTYTATAEPIPYPAEIDGHLFNDTLDSALLTVPGTLYVVKFYSNSENPFLKGSGMAVFHNGTPNGLLYFSFDHDSGYTSLFSQKSCSSSSAGAYWGAMDAQYSWVYFAH